jgi:hypothetical protein
MAESEQDAVAGLRHQRPFVVVEMCEHLML